MEKIGSKISDISRGNIFAALSLMAREIKEHINKWNYIKLKIFWTAKKLIIEMKRESMVWENIFADDTSDKGLISKIYKELI